MAGGVTVHTIFWAPSGFAFQGAPGVGIPTYKELIQQFFTDVAHDSTGTTGRMCTTTECNMFTVLPQFAQGTRSGTPSASGAYTIHYSSRTDSIDDTQPYPSSGQCASPHNATGACLTDDQVRAEVDRVISSRGGARGLHDLWYVFLPPNVDECMDPDFCGTNKFSAYHSWSDVGHGTTIYAVGIDPIIEATVSPGMDPESNPDAEITVKVAAHETVEAMTDPEGGGYYTGGRAGEVGDKCGSQHGTPLGFAANGSPYDQVISGHKYLLQEMWSNDDNGCVQATTRTSNPLPLPQVNLTQFSKTVSGNIGANTAGVGVQVALLRPEQVAQASTTTDATGGWALTLQHPVGDDRDEIDVDYSGARAPRPSHQVIVTGDPQWGWTGWTALDNGTAASNSNSVLQITPCEQSGVLTAAINGTTPIPPPKGDDGLVDTCSTETGVASVPLTGIIGAADAVTVSSNDNRAYQDPNLSDTPNTAGALVRLTIRTGEPDSVSLFSSPLSPLGGFPTCTADLEAQSVSCSGLVPRNLYTVTDGSSHASRSADDSGTVLVSLPVTRGSTVSLSNGSRTLTTLHVANLRVDISGEQTVLSGGSCEADNYYAAPLSAVPTSALPTGEICPPSGNAANLPASPIVQTDENSDGATRTEVPDIENTSPMQGETVYGSFTALAETGLPGPNNTVVPTDSSSTVDLSIAHSSGGSPVSHSNNVDTANGVSVTGLKAGTYKATWTMKDANGDTRTIVTRFVEQSALQGAPARAQRSRGRHGPPGPTPQVTCTLAKHKNIRCMVMFPKSMPTMGRLQVRIARGARVAALGHVGVNGAKATITMHETRHLTRGRWTITVVLTRPHKAPLTTSARLRVAYWRSS